LIFTIMLYYINRIDKQSINSEAFTYYNTNANINNDTFINNDTNIDTCATISTNTIIDTNIDMNNYINIDKSNISIINTNIDIDTNTNNMNYNKDFVLPYNADNADIDDNNIPMVINDDLYKSIDDLWGEKNMQRQIDTFVDKSVPNNQTEFANYLYNNSNKMC